jgi:hypothetical protein
MKKILLLFAVALLFSSIYSPLAHSKEVVIVATLNSDHDNVYMHTAKISVNGPGYEYWEHCKGINWFNQECNIKIKNARPGIYTVKIGTDALRESDNVNLAYPMPYSLNVAISGSDRDISSNGKIISSSNQSMQVVKAFSVY